MQTAALTASDARLIADAREIAAAITVDKQRDFLTRKGSDYAADPDLLMVAAATLGRAQAIAEALALRLEQEIARNATLAAQQSVAHAKLYDLEADANRRAVHEMELQAIREGSPAVQNGPYAYMTGPHADA